MNEEAQNYDITGTQPALMIPESSRFNKTIKLPELAQELQDRNTGLTLVDRTWHFKRHLHCFVGSELVSWLVDCFEDIETREDATTYGQNLMNKGLFKHVELRHGLLDGHFFTSFWTSMLTRQIEKNLLGLDLRKLMELVLHKAIPLQG